MGNITIGIDLGGTRIKAIAMNETGEILFAHFEPTSDIGNMLWAEAIQRTVSILKHAAKQDQVRIGLAAPGLPDSENKKIMCMPGRMQGLEQFDWTGYLQQPVTVMNDAVAAMMGEAFLGAAVGKRNVVMLTLGTGVGGAIMIDGKPYQGAMNKAGHIGHMVINDEGVQDITGMPGSLEDCIGNCTISLRSNGKFSTTRDLLDAYRHGDQYALEVWMKSVRQLAIGLASVANILSPELIVLGGGITEAGDDLFVPLESFMKDFEWQPLGYPTPVVRAKFGDLAGAIGAACYAKNDGPCKAR